MVATRSRSQGGGSGNQGVVLIIQPKTGENRKRRGSSTTGKKNTPTPMGGSGGGRRGGGNASRPPPPDPSEEDNLVIEQDEKEDEDEDDTGSDVEHNRLGSETPRKVSVSGTDEDSDESSEDLGYESEGFEMPEDIEKDEALAQKFQRTADAIREDLPGLPEILTTPMRKRNRKILFEWFHIYQNLAPCSQDRMEARKMIRRLFREYRREYSKYLMHKAEIRVFEKKDRDSNSITDMEYQILALQTTDLNKQVIYRKYRELRDKSEEEHDDEYYKMKQWLQWILRMPFDRTKAFPQFIGDPPALTAFLKRLRTALDANLYGMRDVKDQILLFVHHKLIHPDMKGCSLGLIGDPGVGKTTIARCLAEVMDFPFEQISFGGIRTIEHLKGFDYTYVGSQPGEISKCMSRMGYKNGILFLDEYEKVSENHDVNAFLLHLTDFSQNSSYRDNYLSDIVMDLSCLWLIYSMNQLPQDKALRDRIFAIHVSGYSQKDKVAIIRNFLLPKHVRAQDLDPDRITMDEATARYLVDFVGGNEKGIRRLEQMVKDLVFKICFLHHHQKEIEVGFHYSKPLDTFPVRITPDLIETLCKTHRLGSENTAALGMYS